MFTAQMVTLLFALTGAGNTVLLDFRADWCGPCRAIDPVVHQLGAAGYPVRQVNIDQDRALAAKFHVQSIPCFVLLVDGREVDRSVGQTGIATLEAMFRNAGAAATSSLAAAKSNEGNGESSVQTFPPIRSESPLVDIAYGDPAAAPIASSAPAENATPSTFASDSPPAPVQNHSVVTGPSCSTELNSHPSSGDQLLATCVRLKIEENGGASSSIGSGTIIDARQGEALILTCGHVFRDSGEKGKIFVDLFGPGGARQVPGRLIGYDLESDVGLVGISNAGPVVAARIAPVGYAPHSGDRVVNIGCSHGADPTLRQSRITSVDRFSGPPNIQVAGQPVQGRSGGGLFTADGLVIGVCNAADPADNEGVYAAILSVQKELDRAGLTFIYRDTPAHSAPATAVVVSAAPTPTAPAAEPAVIADAMPPAMPAKMPLETIQTAAQTAPAAHLTAEETATLAELREKSRGAEVICIVRPLADPHAKSEIIVLDKASSAFLNQLSAERSLQETRPLTSLAVPDHGSTAAATPNGLLQR